MSWPLSRRRMRSAQSAPRHRRFADVTKSAGLRGVTILGVRGRLTVGAIAIVLAAMGVGGAGLIWLLEDGVETAATSNAAARAGAVSDVITSIGLSEAAATVTAAPGNGQLVQIVDPDGDVFSASDRRIDTYRMAALSPAAGEQDTAEVVVLLGEPGEWAVVARGVEAREATFVVQVAVPISESRNVVRSAVRYLWLGTPLLVLGTGAAVWYLLGRVLGAVERIRRKVAKIDSRHLASRVEVPRTRDEISRLAVTMNGMLERLERSDAAQRAFISDASHELRSPLASVMAAAELAQGAGEPRRSRLLETVLTESDRLRELVDNLMLLARSDAQPEIEHHEIDLDDVLDQQRRRLHATTAIQVQMAIEPTRILGDERLLAQAVRNLVDNAVRHATSMIRLQLSSENGTAVIRIDNDGPVIPPSDRTRIFQRFVRLDESRSRDAGGSGLGLAIVETVVARHGGQISVVDAPDGWCRFELRLPVSDLSS